MHHRRRPAPLLGLATLCALGLAAAGPARAQVARLTLQSQPGDFVGQGQTEDITYTPAGPGDFSAQILPAREVAGQPAFLRFILGNVTGSNLTNTFTTLDFATDQLGIPIQDGTYLNAERASFADPGHPGLDVTFQNRGSNTLTGSFTVTDVSFVTIAGTTEINTFAASFEQHSEGAPPALLGTFSYRRSPAAVPEPAQTASLGVGALGVLGLLLRARRRPVA